MIRRYFMEVCYRGNRYAGFQIQKNAVTVQGEIEKALNIFLKNRVVLTGSSRTDAGVHARQNYFHFDIEGEFEEKWVYNLNALLPQDISVIGVRAVDKEAHCRFDALYRRYVYIVYPSKDPFLQDLGYYFPFRVDMESMQEAARVIGDYENFETFSKRNSQVKTFECRIYQSMWTVSEGYWRYEIRANRFLRGMVRGLVGTMLQVGRGKMGVEEFRAVIAGRDSSAADFSVPGHGLYLEEVGYPEGYFELSEKKI